MYEKFSGLYNFLNKQIFNPSLKKRRTFHYTLKNKVKIGHSEKFNIQEYLNWNKYKILQWNMLYVCAGRFMFYPKSCFKSIYECLDSNSCQLMSERFILNSNSLLTFSSFLSTDYWLPSHMPFITQLPVIDNH